MADNENLGATIAAEKVYKLANERLEELKGKRDQSVIIRRRDVINPAEAFWEGVIHGSIMVAGKANRLEQ